MTPLSLYIHIPWCVKKCPYCDFNSHQIHGALPERLYIEALIKDLEHDLPSIWQRRIISIFIGGGTPSLFSPDSLEFLLQQLRSRLNLAPDIEITMEANPGTVEQEKFKLFREIGINRLSLGIQSFQNEKLSQLGRIHNGLEAKKAIEAAKVAGFHNFNLDLMFGLPGQTIPDALYDLESAVKFNPTHLSWYQLTIEPYTRFHHNPPTLPEDELIYTMQLQGQNFLAQKGFYQYEISAYSQQDFQCRHNRNYWEFGDYLGIGAGAHSKITNHNTNTITRQAKIKHPKHYMSAQNFLAEEKIISTRELAFEFMLNALRLHEPIPLELFEQRTLLTIDRIKNQLEDAVAKNLLTLEKSTIQTTTLGKQYLNDLLQIFL